MAGRGGSGASLAVYDAFLLSSQTRLLPINSLMIEHPFSSSLTSDGDEMAMRIKLNGMRLTVKR